MKQLYIRRPDPVWAIRYDGTNRAEVAAFLDEARLRYELPDNPALSVMACHIPVMGIDGHWRYLGKDEWLVIRDGAPSVWIDDSFTATYEPLGIS